VTTTTVETGIARKITVVKHGRRTANLHVLNTDMHEEIYTLLDKEEAEKIGLALLGENATVITDLPEAERKYAWVQAGDIDRHHDTDPAEVLDHAKKLLAIHKFLVEKKAKEDAEAEAQRIKEAEEAAKAAELEDIAKRDKRRDELAYSFNRSYSYQNINPATRKAIDHIIELEAAQA